MKVQELCLIVQFIMMIRDYQQRQLQVIIDLQRQNIR